ncbi:MAG: hypothetical protein O2855_03705 [Planctomycetota bacterium]|nr:hypothetical protein [Planctomycetota bacterium]
MHQRKNPGKQPWLSCRCRRAGVVVLLGAATLPAAAEVVTPLDSQFTPGTNSLAVMKIGTTEIILGTAYVFPPNEIQFFDGDADGAWTRAPAAQSKLLADSIGQNDWSDFGAAANFDPTKPTRVRIFITEQPDDEPLKNDLNPELLLIGTMPSGTLVRAFTGGSPEFPLAGDSTFELSAADLRQGQFVLPAPVQGQGARTVSCIGLDASGDLGVSGGARVIGYEVTVPPGAPVSLKIIPISPTGDPDETLAQSLGTDAGSLRLLRSSGRALFSNPQLSTDYPLPDAISNVYGNAPAISQTGGLASPIYNIVTQPPDNGEEFEPDPDDPDGGDPSDPTDPTDPDDPDGGDPTDPTDPPARDPNDNGIIVVRPTVLEDPFAESGVGTESDEPPSVPAPGALVLLGLGSRVMMGSRRRR